MEDFDKRRLDKLKEQLLSVVAFGTNKETVNLLEEFFREKGIMCFFFYETFLSYPISYEILELEKELHEMIFYIPFIRRYIDLPEDKFIPNIGVIKNLKNSLKFQDLIDKPLLIPKDWESFKKLISENFQRIDLLDQAIFAKRLLPLWKDAVKDGEVSKILEEHTGDFPYSQPIIWEDNKNIVGHVGKFPKEYLKNQYLKEIQNSNNKLSLLIEYLISDFQFVLSGVNEVNFLVMSISSRDLFYGYVWVYWAGEIGEGDLKKLEDKIGDIIIKHYLPVMVIFENAWEEYILKQHIKSGKNLKWEEENKIQLLLNDNSSFPLNLAFMKKEGSFENEFEECFHHLWKRRWNLWRNTEQERERPKKLDNTLVFYKFFISSKEMIERLRYVMKLNPSKKGDFLPSALVIGGPGAGKDAISKLIKVFSEEYFEAPVYIINVASLKPTFLAPSLTLGTEISLKENAKINLIGVFEKILRDEKYQKAGGKAVVVLDELNSLDVDTQGALLRLLENSELVPIGGIEPREKKDINFLIIGNMNEDPEKLTKESIIKDITRRGAFGGMLGEILYEHFRNIRRLREDLYYRFVRGGKIVLPSLNERREDIPVLFYVFCDQEIKSTERKIVDLYILFDVLEELTAPHLDWIGNVRQLQSLSQVVIRYALQDKEEEGETIKVIVTKEHLYKGFKDIGMIKDESHYA